MTTVMNDTEETSSTSLNNHYSQPFHQKTTENERKAPCFDALLGRPLQRSAVTQHWIKELQSMKEDNLHQIICNWICRYNSHVRPLLMRQNALEGATVLEQNEIFLSLLLQDFGSIIWENHQ